MSKFVWGGLSFIDLGYKYNNQFGVYAAWIKPKLVVVIIVFKKRKRNSHHSKYLTASIRLSALNVNGLNSPPTGEFFSQSPWVQFRHQFCLKHQYGRFCIFGHRRFAVQSIILGGCIYRSY